MAASTTALTSTKNAATASPAGAAPLHFAAAWGGQLEAAKLLVARGADLDIRDDTYNAPASGWANHFQHQDIEAYLLEAATGVHAAPKRR